MRRRRRRTIVVVIILIEILVIVLGISSTLGRGARAVHSESDCQYTRVTSDE